MGDKFKGKYRIESSRMPNWDYGRNGFYFVTICTGGRECFFGDVIEGKIIVSAIGKFAKKFWTAIPQHFKFVELDEYVIMPNHVHGIIKINKTDDIIIEQNTTKITIEETPKLDVSLTRLLSRNRTRTIAASKKWKSGALGTIMNQYKRIVTIHARKINPEFYWQSRFYDSIIRDDHSLKNVRNYIKNNSKNWGLDDLIPDNREERK